MPNYFEIGKIVNTQGIKGEIRVVPTTDDPSRFELLNRIDISINKHTVSYDIEKIWYHKSFVILKLIGIDDMTAAEKLKNGIIIIPEEKALPLEENEYYLRDLLDMEVISDLGEKIGIITDIIFTGANDVYSVKTSEGKNILIPAIKQCIINVDVKSKKMIVHILEGLI